MGFQLDTSNPYDNRASRTVRKAIGTSVTGVATTDVFTLVGGGAKALDVLENNAPVTIEGTLSGGAGLVTGKKYYLQKTSNAAAATTFRLTEVLNGPTIGISSDLTSGAVLYYGFRTNAADGLLSGDISTPQ